MPSVTAWHLFWPSARRKTTLMKLLAQREEATSGTILINGKEPTYQARRVQGYVEQEGEFAAVPPLPNSAPKPA
jgi:ABC-type sugar transport system ATPase subunit